MNERPVFDMNQCKPGDLLESIHGAKLEYVGLRRCGIDVFTHSVNYLMIDGKDIAPPAPGTRTAEGWMYRNRPLPEDHDVKGFWKETSQDAEEYQKENLSETQTV